MNPKKENPMSTQAERRFYCETVTRPVKVAVRKADGSVEIQTLVADVKVRGTKAGARRRADRRCNIMRDV
jgi:hypothetical protein